MRKIYQQLISGLSLTAITINLLVWIPVLVIFALFSLLIPTRKVKQFSDYWVDKTYRAAVSFDSFWLEKVLRIKINIHGNPPVDKNRKFLIVSNHRSWFDILILQAIIVRQGPIIKFLIKRELIYVPVVGWICLALNFPRLTRDKSKQGKKSDYDSVATATLELGQSPISLLNFAEGTRFTTTKQALQKSPYRHLLLPRAGGMRIMLKNMPQVDVIDVTLVYPEDQLTFWQCLSGKLDSIEVHLSYYPANQIIEAEDWLTSRWQEKELLIAQSRAAQTKEGN